MANETTTTVWSSQILTEILGPVAMPAHLPKVTMIPLINQDSINGAPSLTKQYAMDTDLGQAIAGTEGTDFTTNTELSKETPVTVTPTEGAIAKADITDRAARRKFGGNLANPVHTAMSNNDIPAFTSLIAPEARRIAAMCIEKAENDTVQLLSGLSNTVGSTGVDITLGDMINALFTLKTLEPVHENWAYYLWPNQINELQLALGDTGGGVTGAVWFQQGDLNFFNQRPDAARNGFRGTFMGQAVYEGSHSLRVLVNASADVAGALMMVGSGAPDQLASDLSPFVFVEGAPMRFAMDTDESKRASELLCIYEYATAEIDDANAVGIFTDAP